MSWKSVSPFIRALPTESAELLTAIDIQEGSQKQYAEMHNISYSTLKSRVKKARDELKALFEACCHLSLDKFGNIIDCEEQEDNCTKC